MKNTKEITQATLPNNKQEQWKYFPVASLAGAYEWESEALDIELVHGVRKLDPSTFSFTTLNNTFSHLYDSNFDLHCNSHESEFFEVFENTSEAIRVTHKNKSNSSTKKTINILVRKNTNFILVSESMGLGSSMIRLILEDGASVSHYHSSYFEDKAANQEQNRVEQGLELQNIQVTQNENSQYNFIACDCYEFSKIFRRNLDIKMIGKYARCNLKGISLGNFAGSYIENFITACHLAEACESYQNFRGVWAEGVHGNFYGRILVSNNAQKSHAYQRNSNILLEPSTPLSSALVHSRPELVILADDVKCSHGASLGSISEDSIFYLCSRGLSESQSKRVLTEAFMLAILSKKEGKKLFQEEESILRKMQGLVKKSLEQIS